MPLLTVSGTARDHRAEEPVRVPVLPGRQRREGRACALRGRGAEEAPHRTGVSDHRLRPERPRRDPQSAEGDSAWSRSCRKRSKSASATCRRRSARCGRRIRTSCSCICTRSRPRSSCARPPRRNSVCRSLPARRCISRRPPRCSNPRRWPACAPNRMRRRCRANRLRCCAFLKMYRDEFASEPDGFALGQYDGVMMVLDAIAKGAKTPADVTKALATSTYKGVAMTYKSDGNGNMAHSAVIIVLRRQDPHPEGREALRQRHADHSELARISAPIGDVSIACSRRCSTRSRSAAPTRCSRSASC